MSVSRTPISARHPQSGRPSENAASGFSDGLQAFCVKITPYFCSRKPLPP
ncbi:hypothetical protein [Kingella potus]|nr:hypothetical protein [Kingella potus]UOO99883.1 hypothetical protein LVJ84_07310 [Kingella potus]